MSRATPRVGIGLPVRNGENYLAATLECLLAQTYTDFEIVISDNGSTDRTPEICREFAYRDGRVRYHRVDHNEGAARNFNRTFELAQGEFFKWAAHDDLIAPEFLACCVEALDRRPDAVYCHTRRKDIDADGRVIVDFPTPSTDLPSVNAVYSARSPSQRFRTVLLAPGASLDVFGLARREAMARTRLHRSFHGADKVFLAELALAGPWVEVPEPLFFLRRHAGQSGSTLTQLGLNQYVAVPRTRCRVPRQLRCTMAYLGLVATTRMGFGERLRALGAWCSFVTRPRKWKRLLKDILRGIGVKVRVPEDDLRRPASSVG